LLAILLIVVLSTGIFAGYAFQTVSIPLEVKEPIAILDYPSGFSLYPGETVNFDFTVQNLASVTYSIEFDFRLNDTEYQAKYVTFSNYNCSVSPGTQKLTAWLTIAPTAPPANLTVTINRKTDTESSPSHIPTPSSNVSLTSALKLLGGGAKWAARNGTRALYVNWKDNWVNHHLTSGIGWPHWYESEIDNWTSTVFSALDQAGFQVTLAGDIPETLNGYDLVVIHAWYAVEPRYAPLVKNYLANGGGVVLLSAVPCFFSVYCKDSWPSAVGGNNLTSIKEWFGASVFTNVAGIARLAVDKPFGTDFAYGDTVYMGVHASEKAVTSLNSNARIIAAWEGSSNCVFAFIYEYGKGRLYYQAETIPRDKDALAAYLASIQ
jgi:hypothetical protein